MIYFSNTFYLTIRTERALIIIAIYQVATSRLLQPVSIEVLTDP